MARRFLKNKPGKDELLEKYHLFEELEINNPFPFLSRELNFSTGVTKIFRTVLVVSFLFLSFEFFNPAHNKLSVRFIQLLVCLPVLVLMLMPLHELIHALAFFVCGAGKIKIKPLWKKLAVYTIAPGFISGKSEIVFIGSLPFILISLSLSISFILLPVYRVLISGMFFTHTYCCLGDAAILSFVLRTKKKEIYSFDDLSKNRTYFFTVRE